MSHVTLTTVQPVRLARRAMSNKYLTKLAQPIPEVPPRASTTAKIGLAASLTGLGIGVANYYANLQTRKMEQQRLDLEKERANITEEQKALDQKSLNALRSIHKTLTAKPGGATF